MVLKSLKEHFAGEAKVNLKMLLHGKVSRLDSRASAKTTLLLKTKTTALPP
jgi:hypothetical protein